MPDPSGLILAAPGGTGSSADFNGVAEQTVMIYATAAARTSGLAAKLREGMVTYRIDAKVVERYNGTSWDEIPTAIAMKALVPLMGGGSGTGTSNGAGDITLLHGLTWTPTSVIAQVVDNGSTGPGLLVFLIQHVDSVGFTIRCRTASTGVVLSGANLTFYWIAFGGYGV